MTRAALYAAAALAVAPAALAQVSEGFENGWDKAAWPTYAPDCSQGGTVALDTTTAHTGANSMRVDGAGGFCGHIFFGTNKVPSGDVYVRVWLYVSLSLSLLSSSLFLPYGGGGKKSAT